ncbi:MAG: imidazolonepropionase [Calditrichaeota bacterium]|nr:imidazolonepropionase [Calditrichota bacterium]
MRVDLLIVHAAQVATPLAEGDGKSRLQVVSDGAVAMAGEKVVAVGSSAEVVSSVACHEGTKLIEARGKTVTPGLVDAHTHLVFAGNRVEEFEWRTQGKSYEQIAAAGGGIRASVRQLRRATKEELVEAALPRLDRFLANGVTTVEVKSGYGLSLMDEIKSLQVIAELADLHPVELVPTLLAAHEVPDEYQDRRNEYLDLIVEHIIPRVAEQRLAEFCDVFCERGVFTVAEARRVLLAGKAHGLKPKIHAEQLSRAGGAQLAAEVGATSADHLDYVDEGDIAALRDAGVVPVLLPGAVFFLGKSRYAPAREMLAAGLPVALSTDFNPGTCMSESLPLMMTLACTQMHMTPAEVLVATTLNAARAIDRASTLGQLRAGAQADCVIWDVPDYRCIPYHFGVELAQTVIKRGRVVYRRPSGTAIGATETDEEHA